MRIKFESYLSCSKTLDSRLVQGSPRARGCRHQDARSPDQRGARDGGGGRDFLGAQPRRGRRLRVRAARPGAGRHLVRVLRLPVLLHQRDGHEPVPGQLEGPDGRVAARPHRRDDSGPRELRRRLAGLRDVLGGQPGRRPADAHLRAQVRDPGGDVRGHRGHGPEPGEEQPRQHHRRGQGRRGRDAQPAGHRARERARV